jgi:hypothetical protein
MFSRSILKRANHADLSRVLQKSTSQKTRQIQLDTASVLPEVSSKKTPKRSKKKIEDLPEYFTLPDGTPAKPLGDWRQTLGSGTMKSSLIKDTTSSCRLSSVYHITPRQDFDMLFFRSICR